MFLQKCQTKKGGGKIPPPFFVSVFDYAGLSAANAEGQKRDERDERGRFGNDRDLDVVEGQIGAVRAAQAEQGAGHAGVFGDQFIGNEGVVVDRDFGHQALEVVDDIRDVHPFVSVFRFAERHVVVFGGSVDIRDAVHGSDVKHQFLRRRSFAVLLEIEYGLVHPLGIVEESGRNEQIHVESHHAVGRHFEGVHKAAPVAAVFHIKGLLVVGGADVGNVFAAVVVHPFILAGKVAQREERLLKVGEVIDGATDEGEDGGGAAGFPGVHSDSEPVVVVFQNFPVDRDVDVDGAFHRAAGLA